MNSQDERQHGTLHKALPQQQNPALLMGQSYEATRCSDYEDPSNPTDNDQYTDSSCGYSSSEDIAESSSPPTPLPTGTKSARNQPSSHNQIYHNITHTTKTAGVPVRAAMNDSAGIPMTTVTHTNNNNHESLDTNNYNNNTIFTDTTDNIASSSSSIAINVGDASGTDQCPPDLPPRPLQAVPLLPPRPSQSTLVRAQTIAASSSSSRRRANLNRMSSPPIGGYPPKSNPNNKVNIRRSNTTANIRQHRNGLYKTEAMPVCPDFSHASRRPPGVLNEKPMITTGHRSNYVLAALGSRFFTGHYSLRIWDVHTGDSINTLGDMNNPSENDKIRAILPAPCPVLANEGRFVWVAKQDSNIYIVDTNQPSFNNKMDAHTAPVTFLLRYRNTEVWSIDEAGILNVWNAATRIPVCYGTTMPNATAATIQGRTLWISHERSLRVFDISSNNKASMIADIQTPNELGAITSLITIPFHQNCIFSSHEYGKIARWDATTRKKLQVITVSMYGICSMVTVGQHYVWAGYTTGMIYVYDTQPENWVVVKSWKAHSGAVSHLVVDHSGFVLKSSKDGKDGRAHVFSGDSTGTVGIWDGLLTDYWKGMYSMFDFIRGKKKKKKLTFSFKKRIYRKDRMNFAPIEKTTL
jgi:hypothetical protein